MSHENAIHEPFYSRINWVNSIFLILTPILVVIFLPLHLIYEGLDWRLMALFLFYCVATSISITGGYHRLFSHRSYEARLPLKLFYLIFGSAALQGSALKWSCDHRRHHKHVDSEEDPYNIGRGFFYAHMGWIFFKDDPKYFKQGAPDLKADKWIMLQDKYYFPLLLVVAFLIPALFGLAIGLPWGGLLFGCLARVLITHHSTFFINSLCHMWGSQPYGGKTTARDSFIMAVLTYGEGYHNFHHRFQADYRNGIRWYHWDPTKWLIQLSALIGMTKNLRVVSEFEILKARLQADECKLSQFGFYNERFQELRKKIEESQKRMSQFKVRYQEAKAGFELQKEELIRQIRLEIKIAKIEFESALELWQVMCSAQLKLARI